MSRPSRAHVTAVVVTAADTDHLRQTLAALAAQDAAPGRVIIARTDSDLDVEALAADADLTAQIVDVDATGFGDAVTAALTAADVDTTWLWLLHDDSAPQPGALVALTEAVDTGRSIAIAGCKQVSWSHPDRLISVGVQYTGDIQRFTGIEDGEVDQGQHDDREDVDTVGTAGMLIDREVYLALGGPDRALGSFGDGRDLSRRARLAGHRVVVVPTAIVRHARLSYFGLRREGKRVEADRRESFLPRRASILHSRLVEAPALLVPLVALAALLSGPARAVGKVMAKELPLVGDELWAPLKALSGVGAVLRARRRARATTTGSPGRLRELQATWGDIARVRRDRRLQAAAQRRTERAPSELEMRERAALGTRRRSVLALVVLVTVVLAALTLGRSAFAGPLTGGALVPADSTFVQVWRAAFSPWLVSGDGAGLPADPFMLVLAALSTLTGGFLGTPVWVTVSLLVVAAIPLAALAAWFAAGAATRSLTLRAWAALTWALAPPLILGLGGGRLGPVLAHVMLPLVALGLARAFGVDRRDVVVSGLVGARRVEQREASAPAIEVRRRRLAALAAVAEDAPTLQINRVLAGETQVDRTNVRLPAITEAEGDAQDPVTETDSEPTTDAEPTTDTEPTTDESPEPAEPSKKAKKSKKSKKQSDAEATHTAPGGAWAADLVGDDASDTLAAIRSNTADDYDRGDEEIATILARPSGVGSVGAAAGAGLALAVAAAGAPVLLPAGLVALLLLALFLGPRTSRVAGRARLLLVALPPLVLFGPMLTYIARTPDGWRLLLASPGNATPSGSVQAWQVLLGWPQQPPTDWLSAMSPWLALVAGATVIVAAVIALGRSGPLARGVRLAWMLTAIGVAAALAAPRVQVALGRNDIGEATIATGWAGAGTSLVVMGLIMATLAAGGGLRSALHGRSFGWRQLGVAAVSVVLVGGVVLAGTVSASLLRDDGMRLVARTTIAVPAIASELQSSPSRSRVLALWVTPAGVVDGAVWRANGPQLTQTSTADALADLDSYLSGTADPASASLSEVVARLATGTIADAPTALAAHAVGIIVVPPIDSPVTGPADATERDRLISLLDSIRGLERVTENDSGVVWRVSTEAITSARVVRVDAEGVRTLVPSGVTIVRTDLPAAQTESTIILSDRADSRWRAVLDGQTLRSVESGWQQAFIVPAGASGELHIYYDAPLHRAWRVAIIAVFILTILIALPTRRRRLAEVEE